MEGVWAVKMLSEVPEAGLGQRKVWGRMKWEQQAIQVLGCILLIPFLYLVGNIEDH